MEQDEELYRRVRQGDLAAFDALYERHKQGLFRFIYGYLKSHEESEDVFHEAFMQVLKSSELQLEEGSFQGWVYLVSRNLCLNRIRSRQRGERAVRALDADESIPSAERLLLEHDLSRSVKATAEKLPKNLSQVLQLRLSGLPNQEIARLLEIPVGTVKSRFHAIVQFFRAEMKL